MAATWPAGGSGVTLARVLLLCSLLRYQRQEEIWLSEQLHIQEALIETEGVIAYLELPSYGFFCATQEHAACRTLTAQRSISFVARGVGPRRGGRILGRGGPIHHFLCNEYAASDESTD